MPWGEQNDKSFQVETGKWKSFRLMMLFNLLFALFCVSFLHCSLSGTITPWYCTHCQTRTHTFPWRMQVNSLRHNTQRETNIILCLYHFLKRDRNCKISVRISVAINNVWVFDRRCLSPWWLMILRLVSGLWEWLQAKCIERHIPSEIINRIPAGSDKHLRYDRKEVWQDNNGVKNFSSYSNNPPILHCWPFLVVKSRHHVAQLWWKECQKKHNQLAENKN